MPPKVQNIEKPQIFAQKKVENSIKKFEISILGIRFVALGMYSQYLHLFYYMI